MQRDVQQPNRNVIFSWEIGFYGIPGYVVSDCLDLDS